MSRRNWINLFSNSQAIELSSDLERGYEAALLIQSLELEYYGDRQIRPELKLSVPRSVQATILRRFKTALAICRNTAATLSKQRGQLDSQELRQLQLIESVVSRYGSRRSSSSPSISRSPDALPVRFWVSSTAFASSWIPQRKTASWRGIDAGGTAR